MSDFTDAVEAESRELLRLRTDRARWKKRAAYYQDQRDEARAELVRVQRSKGAQRMRVIEACGELEAAGSDPASLNVVRYALDALDNGAERSPSAERTQAEAEDSAKPLSRAEASD